MILLVFKVTNNNSAGNGVCDFAVSADTDVAGSGSQYIGPIPNIPGVYWSGFFRGFF
jgi:hypothetical protein